MQIWAESGKSALPICNYSQILYQFLTFTQKLKRSRKKPYFPIGNMALMDMYLFFIMIFARIDNQILVAIHVIY